MTLLDSSSVLDSLDDIVGKGTSAVEEDAYLPIFEDLTPFEVEYFVRAIGEFKLEEVGNRQWLTQHEKSEKLNWTAHNQAKEGYDEYVVDQINTGEKLPTLIYDLILIEVWKMKIWPLVKAKIAKFSSLRTYIPLYHEATVVNLLEICLYHRTSCEEAGDALIDLVDYCVRKLRHLLAVPNSELVRQVASAKEFIEWDTVRAVEEQFAECEFQVCMCVISVVRFLTDHRVALPLAVTTRLLETHDVLMLLVPLMEKAPWVRKNRINGCIEKFEEHKWQRIEEEDEGRLPKMHSQVWLAIYNLVMDSECRARYELTSIRRENLLRLRRHINEVVVDQLPPLTNLHRTLEELSISGQFTAAGANIAPAVATPFVVELVAEAWETIVRTYDGRWQEIADLQLREVLVKETPEELKRLGQMISVPKEFMEAEPLPPDPKGDADSTASGQESSAKQATASWEAVLSLMSVRSTASFFAAARWQDAPIDEVLLLTAPAQPTPQLWGKLKLELRRARYGQLSRRSTPHDQAASEAQLASRRAEERGNSFMLAVDNPGIAKDVTRTLPFTSQKGVSKTASQLLQLLQKPGRESLLQMYTDDVAEFSVPVGSASGGEECVELRHIAGLALSQ